MLQHCSTRSTRGRVGFLSQRTFLQAVFIGNIAESRVRRVLPDP